MKKFPNNVVYTRPHKIKTFKGNKGINLSQFTVGLRIKKASYLFYHQFEAARKAMSRLIKPKDIKNRKNQKIIQSSRKKGKQKKRRSKVKRKKFLLIRSNLCSPLTKKPLQVRMGKGKGAVNTWASCTNRSRIIMEMSRQHFKLKKIHKLFFASAIKIPKKVKLTYKKNFLRRETKKRHVL